MIRFDRDVKVVLVRCDICDDHIAEAPDDIETQIDKLDEINNSFESEYDKHEPRLMLCDYCKKEYLIPGYEFLDIKKVHRSFQTSIPFI